MNEPSRSLIEQSAISEETCRSLIQAMPSEYVAEAAHIFGCLMDPKFRDKYLLGWTWESCGSMVVGYRGQSWHGRPDASKEPLKTMIENKWVDFYPSPFMDAYCIRLLGRHLKIAETFMRLYMEIIPKAN